jgi:hypothetical protein
MELHYEKVSIIERHDSFVCRLHVSGSAFDEYSMYSFVLS